MNKMKKFALAAGLSVALAGVSAGPAFALADDGHFHDGGLSQAPGSDESEDDGFGCVLAGNLVQHVGDGPVDICNGNYNGNDSNNGNGNGNNGGGDDDNGGGGNGGGNGGGGNN
jgi:hypothetical protein